MPKGYPREAMALARTEYVPVQVLPPEPQTRAEHKRARREALENKLLEIAHEVMRHPTVVGGLAGAAAFGAGSIPIAWDVSDSVIAFGQEANGSFWEDHRVIAKAYPLYSSILPNLPAFPLASWGGGPAWGPGSIGIPALNFKDWFTPPPQTRVVRVRWRFGDPVLGTFAQRMEYATANVKAEVTAIELGAGTVLGAIVGMLIARRSSPAAAPPEKTVIS